MSPDESKILRDHLVELLGSSHAHATFDAAVRDLPAGLRGKKPRAAQHTAWQLLDGSSFRLPRIAVESLGGENLEGAGRPVDFDVDRPLGEWERGRDRQLDEAIRRLLEQIEQGRQLRVES